MIAIGTGVAAAVGGVAVANFTIDGEVLGTASFVTESAATAIDAGSCVAHLSFKNLSCYGAAAGAVGTVFSAGGLLIDVGLLGGPEALGKALDWAAPAAGALGSGVDSYDAVNAAGRPSDAEQEICNGVD